MALSVTLGITGITTVTIYWTLYWTSVRVASFKAGIKPTAPLSAFDKENSIEFLLDSLHYLYKCLTLTLY